MAGINGTSVLLLVNTGTVPSPVWTVVGSQRDLTQNETNSELDMSSKDAREQATEYGRYSTNLSLDALYIAAAADFIKIRDASRAGTKVQVRRQEAGSDVEDLSCVITSMSESFPDQGPATISIDLTGDGAWTASV